MSLENKKEQIKEKKYEQRTSWAIYSSDIDGVATSSNPTYGGVEKLRREEIKLFKGQVEDESRK
ncbi:hypothetical protein ACWOAN_04015 [Lactococcus taiwanensis]|uniref:hypothetical protein n=1 Tax=Lactococcus taiwanensis TaxID=1151742 RepID=UPI0007B231DA|nr:hypothetical protein [Lactococcus taiwanensis]KZK37022.1 hypothetical protein P7266_1666 [Lactococcus cremoris]